MSSLFDLTGKVAIITGASRGIGEAIAQRMAEAGAKIVIASRKQESLEEVAADLRAHGGGVNLAGRCYPAGDFEDDRSQPDDAASHPRGGRRRI